MNLRKLRGLVLTVFLLLAVGWIGISSVSKIEAEVDITPTIIVSDRNFLPYIRGLKQGPTTTATHPPATITPWATMTQTPTATSRGFEPALIIDSTPTAARSMDAYWLPGAWSSKKT